MAKKKNTKKVHSKNTIRPDTKNIFIACLFIVLWAISLFSELDSTAGFYVYKVLDYLFGVYYQFIFSPIILLLGIFIFAKEGFWFNNSRFFGMILYFLSLNTLIGSLDKSYESFFNFQRSFFGFFLRKCCFCIYADDFFL